MLFRSTNVFSYKYLGKIFDEPQSVFSEEILKPEQQSLEAFVDGVLNITGGHRKAALDYFKDGSIDAAIPPIKALLHIMAEGTFEGETIESKSIRDLFSKANVLNSDWYLDRLKNKQQIDVALIQKKIANLEAFITNPMNHSLIKEFKYLERLQEAEETLFYYQSEAYLSALFGTLGAEAIAL